MTTCTYVLVDEEHRMLVANAIKISASIQGHALLL